MLRVIGSKMMIWVRVYAMQTASDDGVAYSPSPDDDVYVHVSKVYSYSHDTMHTNNRGPFVNGTANGAAVYTITGK